MSATHIHVDGVVLIFSLLFASLLVLLGISFYVLHDDIELTLITDVRERLDEEGYQVSIDFDGRDGTIGGNADDEKTIREIVAITKSIKGVRTIKNEITVSAPPSSTPITNDLSTGLSGITNNADQNAILVESIDDLITSSTPNSSTPSDSDIDNYQVIEDQSPLQNLTEITEQAIIEEVTIHYEISETTLLPKHFTVLNPIVTQLNNDSLLYIEISSFHSNPAIAVKRSNIITKFFTEKGINKQRFNVIWNDSPNASKIILKSFHNKKSLSPS